MNDRTTCPVRDKCLVASICKPGETDALSFPHQSKSVEKRAVFWCAGGEGGLVFVILTSLVEICRFSTEGTETVFGVLGKGQVFGHTSLFNPTAQLLQARACTKVVLCQFPLKELERLIRSDSHIAELVIRSLAEFQGSLEQQIEIHDNPNARIRLKRTLLQLAELLCEYNSIEVELALTHDELADLVGFNRVTVTRALQELEEEGLVKKGHRSVRVLTRSSQGAIHPR
jgi:CRP/FNR family transcriptional regulator